MGAARWHAGAGRRWGRVRRTPSCSRMTRAAEKLNGQETFLPIGCRAPRLWRFFVAASSPFISGHRCPAAAFLAHPPRGLPLGDHGLVGARFRMRRGGLTLALLGTLAGWWAVAVLLAPPVWNKRARYRQPATNADQYQSVLARWASQYPVLDQTELANPSSGFVSGSSPMRWDPSGSISFMYGAEQRHRRRELSRDACIWRAARVVQQRADPYSPPLPAHRGAHLADVGATLRPGLSATDLHGRPALLTAVACDSRVCRIVGVRISRASSPFRPVFGTSLHGSARCVRVASGDWVKVLLVILLGAGARVRLECRGPLDHAAQSRYPARLTIAIVLVMGALLGDR